MFSRERVCRARLLCDAGGDFSALDSGLGSLDMSWL